MTPSIWIEIIKSVSTLAAVAVGAWIALRLYFRQKEYELLKARYLEGGIDVISGEVEHALGVVSHNWARCVTVVKAYRFEQTHFDLEELSKGFLQLDASNFQRVAHHRVQALVGSPLVWEVFQLAMAYCSNADAKITGEIPDGIRMKLKTQEIGASHEDVAKAAHAELQKLHDGSHRYAALTKELQVLAIQLEGERLSFKRLAKFRERKQVRATLSRLESEFREDFARYCEPPPNPALDTVAQQAGSARSPRAG